MNKMYATCCMCGLSEYDKPRCCFVVSGVTLKAACESCIEEAKIQIRTRKATKGGEYGGL